MPSSDPIDILLKSNHWATRLLIEACEKLTPEQFHQKFEMGRGSLHDTLVHVLAATRLLCEVLESKENTPRLDQSGKQYAPADLLKLHDEISAGLTRLAYAHPLDGIVTRSREGKTYSFTRAAVLVHITTHAMHHRAQCLNMLRHLGVSPLPPSSVMEWTWLGEVNG